MNTSLKILAGVAIGGAVIRSMLKAAEKSAQGMRDYFPQREFIDVQTLARSDDPSALADFLGCVDLGCADLGCADLGSYARNPFNVPYRPRRDPMGVPTRTAATGTTSLAANFRQPIVAVGRGGGRFGLGDTDDGLGFSLKKKLKKVAKKAVAPIKKVTAQVKSDIKKVATVVRKDIANVAKPLVRDFKKAGAMVKKDFTNAANLLRTSSPLFKKLAPIKSPSRADSSASGVIEYRDANGAIITEQEYNRQMEENAAYEQQQADMEATAPGEIQYDPSTGTYWATTATCKTGVECPWFYWDAAAKGWKADTTVNTPGIIPESTPESSVSAAEETYPGETLPEGVLYDEGTGLYWTQDATGAWWYFDVASNQFIQEIAESTSPVETLPDTYADQDVLSQIAAEEAGHNYDLDGNSQALWDEGTGLYWQQDQSGAWFWWSEDVQQWQPDGVVSPVVVERETGEGGGFWSWLFDWGKGGMGNLTSRETGNRLYVLRQLGNRVEEVPLQADKDGKVYAAVGGGLGCLGCVDDLAGAEGLGFKLFGRSWGKVRDNVEQVAKDVASKATPSGAIYKYVKEKQPKIYKEFHTGKSVAAPYLMIAGGTVLTVVTVGAGSPAGAAMIASGVVSLGAQGYKDHTEREMTKDAEKANDEFWKAEALNSAGSSAVREDYTTPWTSLDWWMGDADPDQTSLLTIGEQV